MQNSRFAVAVHIFTLLAWGRGEPMTSAFIAGSVNTNPVVVRRLLAELREAGLVSSKSGPGGGWVLERDPSLVRLDQILAVVQPGLPFGLHATPPNPACPVGRQIQGRLEQCFDAARKAQDAELAKTTIADLLAELQD
ncbi:MAG: Rrf2 family transcriptional regulator [Myxococcota bacterium]|nr:Rrf2 family transcriptional regulator [Myxococcota bacterium]